MSQTTPSIQQLEIIKKRIEAQKTTRAEAQAESKMVREQLAKAQKEAVAELGTADPAELRKLYKTNEDANTQKLADAVAKADWVDTEYARLKATALPAADAA